MLNHSSREPSADNIPCPRRQEIHASPPRLALSIHLFSTLIYPRGLSPYLSVYVLAPAIYLFFPAPPTTSTLFPPRTIPLFSMRYGVSWGGGLIINGNDRPAITRTLVCVSLEPLLLLLPDLAKLAPIFFTFQRLPLGSTPTPPRLSSPPTSRRNPLLRVQRRFSPVMTTRGSPIAMGSALRNAGQILRVFGPFLCIPSLSPPRLIRSTPPPHTINIHGSTLLLQPHPSVRRLTAQTRVTYSRDPRFTGV